MLRVDQQVNLTKLQKKKISLDNAAKNIFLSLELNTFLMEPKARQVLEYKIVRLIRDLFFRLYRFFNVLLSLYLRA